MVFNSINPATEQVIGEYSLDSQDQVERKLQAAARAFDEWRSIPFAERSDRMLALGNLFKLRRKELASLLTAEMGKPISQAEGEIDKCADACKFFANQSEAMLRPDTFEVGVSQSSVRYEPLGVILAIMPWNFPFWQTLRFAGPNLMGGNAAMVKHAPTTTGSGMAMQQLFTDAGYPGGVYSTLVVDTSAVKGIVEHPAIAAVTLTGSERAGRSVAAIAGAALKKCVLELGGSDPFLVLGDADIPTVATAAANARCFNSGQSCIAAKRFIIEESVADDFLAALTAAVSAVKVGDPTDRNTQVGPMARKDLADHLLDQVAHSVQSGARVLTGAQRRGPGYYVIPGVLSNVRPGMPAFDDEIFGPVAAVIRSANEDEMIRLANLSRYGLGASIWSKDPDRAGRVASKIQSGCVFINSAVKSDPRLPFGGIKNSGYGRELSVLGIRELMNAKTVFVA
jgi:succinate-semialdehyde dehydrogenase / glutarate-semialdehyde dehydrogenase